MPTPDEAKCPVCAVPWESHPDTCSRHPYRPRTDRERLDWLEANGATVEPTYTDNARPGDRPAAWFVFGDTSSESRGSATLREAIDQAILETQQAPILTGFLNGRTVDTGAGQNETVRIPVDIVTSFDPEITQSVEDLRRQAAARTAIELQKANPGRAWLEAKALTNGSGTMNLDIK